MKPSVIALAIVLVAILGGTIWWAVSTLTVGGTWDMPASTWVFMIVGVIVAIGIGAGLMMLVFWGNRTGHDDDVHRSAIDLDDDGEDRSDEGNGTDPLPPRSPE